MSVKTCGICGSGMELIRKSHNGPHMRCTGCGAQWDEDANPDVYQLALVTAERQLFNERHRPSLRPSVIAIIREAIATLKLLGSEATHLRAALNRGDAP